MSNEIKTKHRLGEKYLTKEGYNIEIVNYKSCLSCDVLFQDGLILHNIRYEQVKNGEVKNPYKRNFFGIGFIGQGVHKSKTGNIHSKAYNTWVNFLGRCYNKNTQIKQPSYIGCSVDERWQNFQIFAGWYQENYVEGYHLDKDILIKGNKVYGPDTCCFVPREINQLFVTRKRYRGDLPIGVSINYNHYKVSICKGTNHEAWYGFKCPTEAFNRYKIEKESYIKEIAEKWKPRITLIVYKALISYEVEIND